MQFSSCTTDKLISKSASPKAVMHSLFLYQINDSISFRPLSCSFHESQTVSNIQADSNFKIFNTIGVMGNDERANRVPAYNMTFY